MSKIVSGKKNRRFFSKTANRKRGANLIANNRGGRRL